MTTDWFAGSSVWGLAVRSLLPLLVATFIALVCRKASPARLHLIWFLGLCACLVLPLTSIALPRWNLELLPVQRPSEAVAKNSEPIRLAPQHEGGQALTSLPTDSTRANLHGDSQAQSSSRSSSATTMNSPIAAGQVPQPSLRPKFDLPSMPTLFLIVWSAGTLIFGMKLILQTWSVNRLLRESRSNEDPVWEEMLASGRSQMEILGKVRLVFHRHEISPMVFGWLRPVVTLPESAQAWPVDKRRLVILHELAHLQRRDLMTQMLAGIVCSLYWFNPLAWLASQQMKRLREIACDDLVVARTAQANQYAETLLAIAKSCRGPIVAGGIAMSRSNLVGHRIRCILDTARRRNPFSARTVMLLVCITVGFSGLFGALSLTSRAQDGKPSSEVKENKQEADTSIRKMTLRVLDENDQPVGAADLHVSIWEFDGKNDFPNRDFKTDERGEIEFPIPTRLIIMRIWASHTGYVSQFLHFEQGTHEDGKNIPETFTFHLKAGHKISGKVVDVNGAPISGVEVAVKLEFEEPIGTSIHGPVINRRLGSATTDDQGHWELTNAPGPLESKDYGFSLSVSHPNYLGDSRGGELQRKQGITSEQIRSGTAILTLEKGVVLTGQITDQDGMPITKGIVIWHERPYYAPGVNESEIDSTGHFKTTHLAPGKYKITVVAPGFAPEQRQVELSHGMAEADFQLKKGHPLKVLVTDSAGKPLPKAYVQVDEWRGTEALYTHVHPNVLTSGIPSRADGNGLFTWDWAPEDAVQYRISAIGYTSVILALIAKDQPHVVQLVSPPTIFGKVTDAVTNKPIESFRVIPVKAFSPDFFSTDFQADSVAKGERGEYRIQFETNGQSGDRYRVRIEADGYRTALGKKDLAVGDAPLQEDFQLEPKPAWGGTVEDSDGLPITEFKVAVGTPTTSPHFRLDRLENNFGIAFEVRGDNHFELPASFEPSLIRVFNDQGFAEVLRQPDETIGTIRLQPWASVTGRLMQDDTPMSNEGVYFYPVFRPGLTEARFQDSYYQRTDADGYFRFDRLPPELGSFSAYLGPWEDSTLTSSESIPVQLEPGKKVELLLGGGGATVHGRVIATGRNNDEFSKNWSLNYLIRRDASHAHSPKVSFSFDPNLPLSLDWTTHPEFGSWLASHQYHFVKLSEDGRLKVHGVEPGDYELLIQLYEQPAGCLIETVGQKVIPVKITESQVASGSLDLGDIEVPCRIGPRPGSDMRAYKFTDAAGVGRLVDDMKDRFVLFHVWATWCGPCMASMPNLKADLEKYKQQPLTAVGLNVDEDRAKAEEVTRSSQLDWAQNYLGANSDLMRQLAVSSVPTYYLIGPDGKLIGSANTWDEIKAMLEGHPAWTK